MYCIPLDTVERVLSWLKPMVPLEELQELMQHLRDVIPDRLLLQLLVTWLNPAPAASSSDAAAGGSAAAAAGAQQQQLVICPFAAPSKQQAVLAAGGSSSSNAQVAAAGGSQAEQWPPLRVSSVSDNIATDFAEHGCHKAACTTLELQALCCAGILCCFRHSTCPQQRTSLYCHRQ
jgi:hypothetical protein